MWQVVDGVPVIERGGFAKDLASAKAFLHENLMVTSRSLRGV